MGVRKRERFGKWRGENTKKDRRRKEMKYNYF